MAREKLILLPAYCAGLMVVLTGSVGAIPHPSSQKNQSILLNLVDRWGPCTLEEEARLAGYLKGKTRSYLESLEELTLPREELAPPSFENRPDIDEESAALLDLKINDLKVSLKEMIETLKLMERLIQQLPADYAKTAPLLWLTVVKDISMEKQNAQELESLGLVNSDWPNIADMVLPRLFSRILEPKLTQLLREEAKK